MDRDHGLRSLRCAAGLVRADADPTSHPAARKRSALRGPVTKRMKSMAAPGEAARDAAAAQ
jgi:hypothetical protein